MSDKIEKLINDEKWPEAREAIRIKLKKNPDDHWLLTRLGLTYYEERKYKKALEFSKKAFKIAPKCPLVLWDYAGSLQMLDQHEKAIIIYKNIVKQSVEEIAYGECGEGKAWARGVIADSFYRLSLSYQDLGKIKLANDAFVKHLDIRGPGCRSIYPLKVINDEFNKLNNKR